MPLKKPEDIPKIPKTRKKRPEAAKAAIPQKKEDKIEYVCKPAFKYDETLRKLFYLVRLETIAEFTSFAYEISVDSHIDRKEREIEITILGLQTNMSYLPNIARAKADCLFEDLIGEYTVHVIKQDGAINSAVFNFNIYKKEIKLVEKFMPPKKNNRLFCDFEVDESEFSFPQE
ncbi:MAG: hypothetical protein ACM3UR_01860 [Bacteroidota bacterium]|jgi:hypothetical protein|nr:hypothetical protein [Ignavibacteria bacterium]HEX2961640.1 hypothetical protein [Ignavibacteriales bacterium]MCU7497937.1 hypothetical protein [Ignavibacteria bacterium]MCU7504237.1 hypothetical protein [Ignavibacteria bacterium]MCU7513400.1 hypothetical protein [Ignavibacteria bacterium]